MWWSNPCFLLLHGLHRRWFQDREDAALGLLPESKLRERAAQEEEGATVPMAPKRHDSVKLKSFKAGKSEIEVISPALKQGTRVSALQFREGL